MFLGKLCYGYYILCRRKIVLNAKYDIKLKFFLWGKTGHIDVKDKMEFI